MAKIYKIIEEKEDSTGALLFWGTIFIVVLCIVFVLSPGIFITSVINTMTDLSSKSVWGWSIIFSGLLLGLCWLKGDLKLYVWLACISTAIMLLIHWIIDNSFVAATFSRMFS